jgi:hypothetical protein
VISRNRASATRFSTGLEFMSAQGTSEVRSSTAALAIFVALAIARAAPVDADDRPQDGSIPTDHETLDFLKSLPREWSGTSSRDCKTYEDKNVDRLSRPFAASAAAFLRAFVEVHGHVTITSAHRTAEEQVCVCEGEKGPCAGRPRIVKTKKGRRIVKRGVSRHQDGIALDVRAGTGTELEFACMQEFARFNPQFGVHFPMGKRDWPHMEPVGRGRGNVRLAALGAIAHRITPCATLKMMLTDEPLD